MTLNFDPVTLTFDLWPWTFVVCRLCRSETVYEIWAQSGNPRRCYCSLNFDLMTLNIPRVSLCSEILYTKFKLSQAIHSWNMTIFFTLIRHVMLWPWPLTLWPWTFVVRRVSRVQCTYQIWARSILLRLSYWRLTTDFSSVFRGCSNTAGAIFKNACTDLHQIGGNIVR